MRWAVMRGVNAEDIILPRFARLSSLERNLLCVWAADRQFSSDDVACDGMVTLARGFPRSRV